VKRTIQILTTHNSYGTAGLVHFGGNRGKAFLYRTLIIFLTTTHFLLAAIGTAQVRTQKKVGNTGQVQAQSTVTGGKLRQIPDFKGVTLEEAKNVLIKEYRHERIFSPPPEPSNLQAGEIYEQNPRAGATLSPETLVTLHVSNGIPPVPPTAPTADVATSAPPQKRPPTFPPPWVLILILVVAGSGVAGGGTYVIWHWLRPSPVPPNPAPVPTSPTPPPLPPVPVVKPSVNLEPGRSSVDELRMTGPEMHLRTDLEMGTSIFDGPVPIIRREVINE
jgi:hypothetical protein